jgi:hypothetical protein
MHLLSPTFGLTERVPLGRAVRRTLLQTIPFIVILVIEALVMPTERRGVLVAWAVAMPFVFVPIMTFLPWLIAPGQPRVRGVGAGGSRRAARGSGP